jgi:hypothetical protein
MTPLAALAPDQRAVLELVLRQGRSYGELSELLGIPEREVRDRAESALLSLAGEPGDPSVDTGRIADWLLGQQPERAAAATRDRVGASEPARAWAARAAERLRDVGGASVPEVPGDDAAAGPVAVPADGDPAAAAPVDAAASAAPVDAAAPASAPAPAAPRPRPLRESPAPATPGVAARSSRVGGAVLLGVVAVLIAGFLIWFLNRGDGSTPASAGSTAAKATPTATATAAGGLQATGNDIVLAAVGGGNAQGLMRLFKAKGGGVQFLIGAQGVPNNAKGEFYAVWFTRAKGAPRLLGFPQAQVTNGTLTVGGPGNKDMAAFPRWFATFDKVLITRETNAKPARPGPAVLQGTLPHGKAAG